MAEFCFDNGYGLELYKSSFLRMSAWAAVWLLSLVTVLCGGTFAGASEHLPLLQSGVVLLVLFLVATALCFHYQYQVYVRTRPVSLKQHAILKELAAMHFWEARQNAEIEAILKKKTAPTHYEFFSRCIPFFETLEAKPYRDIKFGAQVATIFNERAK